jgi:glyoxylase-like metal-dependent hydrolase (beta-lactamase superfamily II)
LHAADKPTWELYEKSAAVWGVPIKGELPIPAGYFAHGDTLQLGDDTLEVRWVPGHSPGHVVFVNYKQQWVIGGDVLFNGSVGRTDLPGGDFATLEAAIQRELYSLPDEFKVFCGHGPATTIGDEKRKNPFVRG